MNPFKRISVADAQQLLNQKDCLLLDYRDPQSYRAAHVENALNVHEALVQDLIANGDKAQPLVIYCYHGNSSQQFAAMMAEVGFNEVYSVDGGFESWKFRL